MPRRIPSFAFSLVIAASVSAVLAVAPTAHPDSTDRAVVVDGENRLGFDVLTALRASNKNDNLVVSPLAIGQTMEAVAAGSRGATRDEVLAALRIPRRMGIGRVMDASRNLREELEDEILLTGFVVSDKNVPINAPFRSVLQDSLGQRLLSSNLGAPEQVRAEINSLVANLTFQNVPDLVADGSPPPQAKLLAGGAFGFRANWVTPFTSGDDLLFHVTDAKTVTAARLGTGSGGANLSFRRARDFQAILIPYRGARLAMLLMIPDPGKFQAVEARLNATEVFDTLLQMRRQKVDLSFPLFRVGTRVANVADAITGLVTLPFTRGKADLSPISKLRPLAFDAIIAGAVVNVESGGTDAATGIAPIKGGAQVGVTVDRPFMFAVVDRPTSALLAVGRIVDPSLT